MRRDDIRRLTEQRKSVFAQMHKLNEDAEKENRSLSGEESEQFDKLATEFEELKDREERATKLFVQEREVEKMVSTPIEKRIGDGDAGPETYEEYRSGRDGARREDLPEFRSAFWHYISAQSVSDLDVEEHRALTKGTTTAGGYLVPTGFYNQIIRSLRDMGAMAQLATEMVTDSGETIQVPANTAHGTAAWLAESGRSADG
jgi:HK97 family phage major capsid protein